MKEMNFDLKKGFGWNLKHVTRSKNAEKINLKVTQWKSEGEEEGSEPFPCGTPYKSDHSQIFDIAQILIVFGKLIFLDSQKR